MTIHESAVRILNSKQVFGEAFYEVFFERHPEVRSHFSGTDMKRQALILTMALSLIEEHYSNGYSATEKYIRLLGTHHHDRAIPKDLFPKWREAMIETLERFLGGDWTDGLAREWTQAIDGCAQIMFEGYEQRFTV